MAEPTPVFIRAPSRDERTTFRTPHEPEAWSRERQAESF
jgi:hypothetical protein